MSVAFSIRSWQVEDVDAVFELISQVIPQGWSQGALQQSFGAQYRGWVVLVAEKIVGFALILIQPDGMELLNLAIMAAWQRQKLATALLEHIFYYAEHHAIARCYLEVRASNQAALACYQALGFAEIGRRRGYYPQGDTREDAVVLCRIFACS